MGAGKTSQHAEADVYAAIAHPARRQLLDLLRQGERSVTQLSTAFAMSRPAVSQHLHILLSVGLVTEQRHGRERRYRLRAEPLEDVSRWLAAYEAFWHDHLRDLGTYLEGLEEHT
jgi:DNA-binding transcriptional ArsR family regulator